MKTRLITPAVLLAAALLTACRSANQQSSEQLADEQPTTQTSEKSSKVKGGKSSDLARKETQRRVETGTILAGAALSVRLTTPIDTGKAEKGSEFEGSLTQPLLVNGVEVAPVGSVVTGKVTQVVSSGRLNRPAELSLVLTSLTPQGGKRTAISTEVWSMKGQSHKKRDIEMIGGGAGVGALVGAIVGKGKGAAIGGAVGAGAGTAGAAITGKKEIVLGAETKLDFTLNAPATISRTHSS